MHEWESECRRLTTSVFRQLTRSRVQLVQYWCVYWHHRYWQAMVPGSIPDQEVTIQNLLVAVLTELCTILPAAILCQYVCLICIRHKPFQPFCP